MATINIKLDVKSIKEASKQIQLVQSKLRGYFPTRFINKCLKWIENRANEYLSSIDMDGEVITDIQSSWRTEKISKNAKRLINESDKAVFVEFGVGKIGERNAHPQANEENYEYNIQTKYKQPDGTWIFDAEHKQYAIDLNEGYYVMFGSDKTNRAKVKTKGSPANLYLYNAGMDLVSTGAYKMLWAEALRETLNKGVK